jgi:phospholipid-binding lipoprotein MlaA
VRAWGAPAALLLAASLGACATPGGPPSPAPTAASAAAEAAPPRSPIQIFDPLERFNRNVYWFNADFDRNIFLPVVRGYEYVTPVFVRRRVSDFFNNLAELRNAMNGLLQARPEVASRAVIRFAVNSTVGLLGTFDVADDMGVAPQPEDLGLTLGRWGVPAGPYLVLPILCPSNFRDAAGRGGDILAGLTVPPAAQINDTVYFSPAVVALFAVDARHQIPFRYYQTGSPFEYDFVRFLYTKSRELRVRSRVGPQPYSAAAAGSTAAAGAVADIASTAGGEPFGGF